ncbi:hypothetical protein COLO4_02443 [Corchorus olitorius]|uniref:Uncharacterized protein n=1 Tax=Corchorus olitorius TaxID=93759 RepID=A0A1R3L122_9ROSI|nr:hypothetical protein COLO4_02443 [Corchorus olitorius]
MTSQIPITSLDPPTVSTTTKAPTIATNTPILVPSTTEPIDRGGTLVGVGVNGDSIEKSTVMEEDTSQHEESNGVHGVADLGSDAMQS